jgi:hypothetical protein
MTNENLERLKKLLEGTEFDVDDSDSVHALVKSKDPWEGVEFVECITDKANNFRKGKVYRLVPGKNIKGPNSIYTEDKKSGIYGTASTLGLGGTMLCFNPSTEEAYVNQLKDKAFELYGDIKDGDFFEFPEQIKCSISLESKDYSSNWNYTKIYDNLRLHGFILYEKGKWAKKLPKRIEVAILNIIIEDNYQAFEKCKSIGKEAIFDYMSKQLEKLLNDEVD